ncbi:MAG TPA: hypothetical protein VNG90_00590 [Candidatus Acidoferrum sp.]|nr:hypothetical protein [Candidatus Acidoferrum sp.]
MHKQPVTYSVSKVADKLDFNDTPPGEAVCFEHDFGAYSLEARILFNQARDWPWVMSIHGARADYTGANPTNFALQQHGISLLTPNLSAHNAASPIPLEAGTPQQNIDEASAFYQYLDPVRPKTLIAMSLGAVSALKILSQQLDEIDKVVLFGPAVYPVAAYDKHYVTELPPVLRAVGYRDNDVIEPLSRFRGKLLLVKGEYDGLDATKWGKPAGHAAGEVEINGAKHYSPIPKEVIDMIIGAVPDGRARLLEIPGAGHSFNTWARQNPDKAPSFIAQIADFILDNH